MQLTKCSCGRIITTKNKIKVARNELGLWLTCVCESTAFIPQAKKNYFDPREAVERLVRLHLLDKYPKTHFEIKFVPTPKGGTVEVLNCEDKFKTKSIQRRAEIFLTKVLT